MDDLLSIAGSNAVAATVLALMAILVAAVYRRPALVHGLWMLVLLKLVTPPLLFLPLSWPTVGELPPEEIAGVREEPMVAPSAAVEEREAVVIVPAGGEQEPASGGRQLPDSLAGTKNQGADAPRSPMPLWPQLLSIVWAVGALAWFFLALERLHRFRRLLRFAHPASVALQERTRCLAQSLGLKRCPRVGLLPGRIAPMLWAVGGAPRLLVPADLVDLLNDEQLDTLLLHELAHLRRRDHWVRILEFVVMGLYWWHPVVWYARRELREAEEQCCDAWVVSTLPGAGRTYASALLETLDFLSTAQAAVPPLASGLGQIADLKRRLTMIMRGNTPRSLTWPGCLAVFALGLTFLPMLPALQGQPPSKEDASKTDVEAAKERLKAAQEELQRQKAMLEDHQAALTRAEAELKTAQIAAQKATYQATLQQAKLQRQKAMAALGAVDEEAKKNKPEGERKATYRIEITLPAEMSVDEIKVLCGKIADVVPKKLRDRIRIRISAGRDGMLDESIVPVPPAKSSEKRINDLEKKLEKVLRELHDLRRKLGDSPPAAPVPAPAAGAAPPMTPPPGLSPARPPSTPSRLVPAPVPQSGKTPRPAPRPEPITPSPNNPYYAPTVPLKTPPADPPRP